MTSFPVIDIIKIADLVFHETEDNARTVKLEERIRADGFLKNPVIVGRLSRTKAKYLLLDGIHRISALRNLGCRDVVAQVVDYSEEDVKVEVWHRFVHGISPATFLDEIKKVVGKDLRKETKDNAIKFRKKKMILMHLLLANGSSYVIRNPATLEARIEKMEKILNVCASVAEVHRTSEEEAGSLLEGSRDATAIVFIPQIEKSDIIQIALSNMKLPAGITRHIIPCRALGLLIDLALLKIKLRINEKSKVIQEIVKQRVDDERVRFYAEPVLVFSE